MSNTKGFVSVRAIIGVTLFFSVTPLLKSQTYPTVQPQFPTFKVSTPGVINDQLGSDSPASLFLDTDGTFHYETTLAQYDKQDNGDSFVTLYTGQDMGRLNNDPFTYPSLTYDTFVNKPGTYCYQISKRATHPIDSPLDDDHCDVIGIWVDPESKNWYGIVHDEFNFNPWSTTDRGDVYTGIHFDRMMYAISSDHGSTWELQDEIITSPFGDKADPKVFPGSTWYYGDGDPRLYVDHLTGYFYVYYMTRVFGKNGALHENLRCVARAPIAKKMAKGSWNKWYQGGWGEPGIGGKDGIAGTKLNVEYNPVSDSVTYKGVDAGGHSIEATSFLIPADGLFSFSDPTTSTAYHVNTKASPMSIVRDPDGQAVNVVDYKDFSTGQEVTISIVSNRPQVIYTDLETGASTTETVTANSFVYHNPKTNALFGNIVTNTGFTVYSPYLGRYIFEDSASTYVYANDDLSDQSKWTVIGQLPPQSDDYGYYSWLVDGGSLATVGVAGSTYRRYDVGPTYNFWNISFPAADSSYKYAPKVHLPIDRWGDSISSDKEYEIVQAYRKDWRVREVALDSNHVAAESDERMTGSKRRWKFIPVADPFDASIHSGFYRIANVATGLVLGVEKTGTGAEGIASQRAYDAHLILEKPESAEDPTALSGNGSPGGSDQWYLEPVPDNKSGTLCIGSDSNVARNTSIARPMAYKLVNRNSGLVLEFASGTAVLQPDHFGRGCSDGSSDMQQDQSIRITPRE